MSRTATHILFIAEFSTGGSIESLLCLVGGLDKQAFRATVLFYTMPEDAIRTRLESAGATVVSLYPRGSDKGVRKHHTKYDMQTRIRGFGGRQVERWYESFKFAVRFLRLRRPIYKAILARILEIRPDLVHLNNGVVSDMPGIWAARAGRVPMVCHIRTFSKLTYLSIKAARSVDRFVCISRAVRDVLTDYGIDTERCVVIPNAVDLQRFDESEISTTGIREEFGWDESHKLFALVGRVVSWKGQDYFIEAIAEARESDPSIRGLIVGNGEGSPGSDRFADSLRLLIKKHDLEKFVRFTGHRTDIPNIMKAADAVICASSLPEPFGRVIIESMAVGTPAVATNAGGAADIISDGTDGLLVPIKDSKALAQAMLRLSRDDALVQELRLAAMQTVAERYTVKQHVSRVCGVYHTLLDSQQTDSSK